MTDLGTWRQTAHDRDGQRCCCAECAPIPTVSLYEAIRSPSLRRERDLQEARRRRLKPDEVDTYLRYLQVYDLHTEARVMNEARDEVGLARLDLDLHSFWFRHEAPAFVAPRHATRRLPPKRTPRVA